MSAASCCCRLVGYLVVLLAVFVGWLMRFPIPEGAVFAIIFPLSKGYLPYQMFGQQAVQTAPAPDDMAPLPRPEGESFLTFPGGHKVPQGGIGMCCRSSAYDPESVYNTVLWYLLQGGRHIDTADVYTNHAYIGRAIKEAGRRGIPRSDIFVTTKLWPGHFGFDKPQERAPVWLEELGLDYVDLVLMHFPAPLPFHFTSECSSKKWTKAQCRQETWKALSLLRDKGLIRNVGVSNFNIVQMQQVSSLGLAPIATNQFQWNPWAPDWQREVFDYCKQEGVAVTAYGSFGGVFSKSTALTEQRIRAIAATHNASVAQVLLRWSMQKGCLIIPGTGNPKHQVENMAVFQLSLTEEEMSQIDECGNDEGAKAFFYINPVEPED